MMMDACWQFVNNEKRMKKPFKKKDIFDEKSYTVIQGYLF